MSENDTQEGNEVLGAVESAPPVVTEAQPSETTYEKPATPHNGDGIEGKEHLEQVQIHSVAGPAEKVDDERRGEGEGTSHEHPENENAEAHVEAGDKRKRTTAELSVQEVEEQTTGNQKSGLDNQEPAEQGKKKLRRANTESKAKVQPAVKKRGPGRPRKSSVTKKKAEEQEHGTQEIVKDIN